MAVVHIGKKAHIKVGSLQIWAVRGLGLFGAVAGMNVGLNIGEALLGVKKVRK